MRGAVSEYLLYSWTVSWGGILPDCKMDGGSFDRKRDSERTMARISGGDGSERDWPMRYVSVREVAGGLLVVECVDFNNRSPFIQAIVDILNDIGEFSIC